jgi:hypothetical protein
VTTRLQIPVTSFEEVDRSVLVSPQLPNNTAGPVCADWWYMMHGTENTQLNVYLIPDEDFTSTQSIWKRTGDQGHNWQHGQIQIDPSNKTIQIVYEVLAVWSIRSEVSLDDLTLIDGPCIQPDFYSVSCTFEEEHICGYSSDPTGEFSWKRNKGSTPTTATGANEGKQKLILMIFLCKICVLDHTLGTQEGHFMYIGM